MRKYDYKIFVIIIISLFLFVSSPLSSPLLALVARRFPPESKVRLFPFYGAKNETTRRANSPDPGQRRLEVDRYDLLARGTSTYEL